MYITYDDRQKFGQGEIIVRYPDPNPERKWREHKDYHKDYEIGNIILDFPMLASRHESISSLQTGGLVHYDYMMNEVEEKDAVYTIEHHATFWTMTGFERFKSLGAYGSPDRLTHEEFVQLLFQIGQDPTNRLWLVKVVESNNNYGEFLFLDFYDTWGLSGFQLWGHGWKRGTWKFDWSFNRYQKWGKALEIDRRATRKTHNSNIEYLFHFIPNMKQPVFDQLPRLSAEQKAFDFVADLTDDDAAQIEIEDNSNIISWFSDDEGADEW